MTIGFNYQTLMFMKAQNHWIYSVSNLQKYYIVL